MRLKTVLQIVVDLLLLIVPARDHFGRPVVLLEGVEGVAELGLGTQQIFFIDRIEVIA